jgi:hypothetical protein
MGISREDVEKLLWEVVDKHASVHGKSDRTFFLRLVKKAAQDVFDDGYGRRTDEAVFNLGRILREGQKLNQQRPGRNEFSRALSSLCPIWPFC